MLFSICFSSFFVLFLGNEYYENNFHILLFTWTNTQADRYFLAKTFTHPHRFFVDKNILNEKKRESETNDRAKQKTEKLNEKKNKK